MKKSELNNLVAGNKVISKKDNTVLEVVGLEGGKYILSNGKCYSESTIYRWFDVKEVEQPVEDKPVEEKPVQPVEPIITEEKTVEDKQPKEDTREANSHTVAGKNGREEIFSQFNKVLDNHNCHWKENKEYFAVKSPRKKGTLLQVVRNKQGSVHIDIKKSVWGKLKDAYKVELEKTYSASVYDKSRGYIRLRNMEDVNTFTVLLLVALS